MEQLFEKLWQQYVEITPSAQKIKLLFTKNGNTIYNDHVAFRTFDDDRVNIDVLAKPFIALGYVESGTYTFEKKKLFAKHFEHKTDKNAPRVFISQLLTKEFSKDLQTIVKETLDTVSKETLQSKDLIFKGRLWPKPSFKIYQDLQKESEYAAWLYVNGFCANHFTVNVNKLNGFKNLEVVNTFLKDNGFKINASGGEIKGTPEQLLQQSSTLADKMPIDFIESTEFITTCYYEFAYRHKDKDGHLFSGFIAKSADKIFESTDMKLQ